MDGKKGKYERKAADEDTAEREHGQALADIEFQKLLDSFCTVMDTINSRCAEEGCKNIKHIQKKIRKTIPAYCFLVGIDLYGMDTEGQTDHDGQTGYGSDKEDHRARQQCRSKTP